MQLTDLLDSYSRAYYDGNPLIPDSVFDKLAEAANYQKVGASGGDTPHIYPLYSLRKLYIGKDNWQEELPASKCVKTPKLDGANITAVYSEGKLVQVLTRGNGKVGKDITNKFIGNSALPNTILDMGLLQITFEVVTTKDKENPRNYCAGALNLKSLEEFAQRELYYVAHNVQPSVYSTYSQDMDYLRTLGFITVLEPKYDFNLFPQDGFVFRLDSNAEFEEMGFTSHHPRGAFALKENQEAVVTTLKDVVWQVGKSGKVTPVAILNPVEIGDAIVTRASLHNAGFIEELDISIGDSLELIRAGEIIPYVVGKV